MVDEKLLKSAISRISSWTVPDSQEPILCRGFYTVLMVWPLAFLASPILLNFFKQSMSSDLYTGLAMLIPQLVLGIAVIGVMVVDGDIINTLNLGRWRWRYLAIGAGSAIPILFLNGGISQLWLALCDYLEFQLPNETALEIIIKNAGTGLFITSALMAVILAPIVEEVVFRRVIFSFASIRQGIPVAFFLTSAVFALIHLDLKNLPGLFVLGMAFQTITLLCRSLYPAVIMHSTNNIIAVTIIYAIKKGWIEI
ncbi:MAG: CPBP family intramembrane metalloprotease [Victivallaceae bacterium]|nr:CPBP family intramembrane metalloprotease [Victivallaceae bacterium]